MAVDQLSADDAPDTDAVTASDAAGGGRGAFWRRWLSQPLFVAAVLGGLYVWIQSLELDSIEQRTLTVDFLRERLVEHLYLSAVSTAVVIAIAVPLGILITRPATKRFAPYVIGLGNAGQAIPSLGLITIIYLWWGFGVRGVVAGLVAYSLLPILRNTMVGLQQVDESLIESARGMGMSTRAVLLRVEMPLAVPIMLAGIRTALIINVGTAALAFLFGAGGLGEVIFRGFQLGRNPILVTGAVMVSALALLFDYVAGIAEEVLSPRGL